MISQQPHGTEAVTAAVSVYRIVKYGRIYINSFLSKPRIHITNNRVDEAISANGERTDGFGYRFTPGSDGRQNWREIQNEMEERKKQISE